MNSRDLIEPPPATVRILGFSDTYGAQAGNGVGRFLQDLHERSRRDGLPLELLVPGRGPNTDGVTAIRAPSFVLPGYSKLSIATPLEHHRKQVERRFRSEPPDCVHVSTPGPFGCLGHLLATRYRVTLVGIYHTDFPSYARQIARQAIEKFAERPSSLGSLAEPFIPKLIEWAALAKEANPEFDKDLFQVSEILSKNWQLLEAKSRGMDALVDASERLMAQAVRKFYSAFSLVIARSNQQRSQLRDLLGLPDERIQCLRPGTDIDRFHPRFRDRGIWRNSGISEDAFVSLYVGRVTAEKNIDWLLAVWEAFQSRASREAHLVMVGHGEPEELERAAKKPNVHVWGSLDGDDLSSAYASADCFVFPSVTETLGQVGLEAGASGLPVLVSDRGGQQMYVKDGETGYVCSATELEDWVQRLNHLCCDSEACRSIGEQAHRHIADNYSMDHSIASYWKLHRQAVEAFQGRQKPTRKSARVSAIPAELKARVPSRGVMFVSDYHAGRRFGSESQRRFKQAAVERMLTTAVEQDLEVVFGGDFGDHGARYSRFESDFASFRKIRERVGLDGAPVFLRGNHDYGFTDEQLSELLGGCTIHPSLVYFHESAKITMTHGHILALAKTVEVINSVSNRDLLIDQLTEDRLDEDLKPSVIAYDLANLAESTMSRQGLTGLTALWEGMYSSRAGIAEHLLQFGRRSSHADEATWKMIAGLVGTHDNVEVASQLGERCGGWASLFGHTHEALVTKKSHADTERDSAIPQIVANSGHINCKQPTCVIARFPTIKVMRYSGKRDALLPLTRESFSGAEIRRWAELEESAAVRVA